MNDEIFKSIEECEAVVQNANNLIDIADAVLNVGKDVAPDNTEQAIDYVASDNDSIEDIFELFGSIETDQVSPKETKKLAQDTKKFLKRIQDEDSYNNAMEIIK